jgi:hypothetical protein
LPLELESALSGQRIALGKITSVKPPSGIDALYSLRITQARRAVAYREGDFLRLLSIPPDHDATYGKK